MHAVVVNVNVDGDCVEGDDVDRRRLWFFDRTVRVRQSLEHVNLEAVERPRDLLDLDRFRAFRFPGRDEEHVALQIDFVGEQRCVGVFRVVPQAAPIGCAANDAEAWLLLRVAFDRDMLEIEAVTRVGGTAIVDGRGDDRQIGSAEQNTAREERAEESGAQVAKMYHDRARALHFAGGLFDQGIGADQRPLPFAETPPSSDGAFWLYVKTTRSLGIDM